MLALDTPSGLDVTTGHAVDQRIQGGRHPALALPDAGLLDATEVGALFVADISVPALVYQHLGVTVPSLFGADTIIEIQM